MWCSSPMRRWFCTMSSWSSSGRIRQSLDAPSSMWQTCSHLFLKISKPLSLSRTATKGNCSCKKGFFVSSISNWTTSLKVMTRKPSRAALPLLNISNSSRAQFQTRWLSLKCIKQKLSMTSRSWVVGRAMPLTKVWPCRSVCAGRTIWSTSISMKKLMDHTVWSQGQLVLVSLKPFSLISWALPSTFIHTMWLSSSSTTRVGEWPTSSRICLTCLGPSPTWMVPSPCGP